MEERHWCQNCDACSTTHKLLVCAACKTTHYCSVTCQKTHWKAIHKTQCGKQKQKTTTAVHRSSQAVIMAAYDKWKPTATDFLGLLGRFLLPYQEQWGQAVISVTFSYHPEAKMKIQLDEHPTVIPIQQIPEIFPIPLVVSIMAILQRQTTSPTVYYLLTCTSCPQLLRVAPICMDKHQIVMKCTPETVQQAIRNYNSGIPF